jgi:hypothetical protein
MMPVGRGDTVGGPCGSHGSVRVVTVAGERGSYDVVVAGGALARLGELLDQRVCADEVREVIEELRGRG